MNPDLASLLVTLLSILGPAPKDANLPTDFQLKSGDQIVAIGDSITQGGGYLKFADQVLAAQYPDLKLPKIINVGISGQKAEDLIKRFEKDVVAKKPAVVTISIGINDVWHRESKPHDEKVLAAYKENVGKMVDMAQKANIKVIVLTPTLIQEDPETEGNKRLKLYVAAEKEIAAEKKATFIDLHHMFLKVHEKHPEDKKGKKWLTSDGVHMAPLGDALMAVGVLRGLGVPDAKIAVPPAAAK